MHPPPRKRKLIRLSEPEETYIIPASHDRIDAEIGPDNRIRKLIIYVRRRPRRRRWLDRIWR